uniref:NAD-dependent epimerase/dehydratase domain-containing protein n=1 Tax=Neobodo designis TaxID=312471 RepID=A0A7S1R0P8_NEODS|mmetsp:Transcript_5886/g.18565  ORF Transcript_5886/g.18565 Transcript_5886/m.18565 type:complete len:272 (+) Transcript_5886:28-843(+)
MSAPKKLVIFGANGYVGGTIARIAANSGVTVVGASRSGAEPLRRRNAPEEECAWVSNVHWSKVDATKRADVNDFLDYHSDADAVITSIGALTLDHAKARRINGDANVNICSAVYERPAIRRLVYISAMPMYPATSVLKGYYYGKHITERAMGENLQGRGVALRPGMVSGTRIATSHGLALPLWLAGKPMELVFRPLYAATGLTILTPPSEVEDVARAALYSALQGPIGDGTEVADYYGIKAMSERFESEALRISADAGVEAPPSATSDGAK